MPQLRFLQTFVSLALLALVAVVSALPLGARRGARAGRALLRASTALLALAAAGCVAWGVSSGEWRVFWRELGVDALVQIGVFIAIVYSTGYNFVSRYLDDKAREEREGARADA